MKPEVRCSCPLVDAFNLVSVVFCLHVLLQFHLDAAAGTSSSGMQSPTSAGPSHDEYADRLSSTVDGLRRIYLAAGMVGRLTCPVEQDPPNKLIVWLKDGRPVDAPPPPEAQHRRRVDRVRVGRTGSLVFRSPDASDEGVYACLSYSPLESGQESRPVRVLVRDPPHFIVRPRPFYQRQPMQTVHMSCVARGDPPPTVVWRKAGAGAFPSTTRTLQNGGNLTIARLTADDAGGYECIASNVIADVVTTSFVIVEASARHAAYNVTVSTSCCSANVAWFPAFDSGLSQHYVIWYTSQNVVRPGTASTAAPSNNNNSSTTMSSPLSSSPSPPSWLSAQVAPVDATSVTLHDLVPDTTYRFVVQSVSCCGASPAAVAARPSEAQFSDAAMARTTRKGDLDFDDFDADNEERDETSSRNPADVDGVKRPAKNVRNGIDRRPGRPQNVTVTLQRDGGGLIVDWRPAKHGSVAQYYVVEYRTVGPWVRLSGHVTGNATNFRWTTASRGATYHFRVRAFAADDEEGDSSDVITYNTGDPMSGTPSHISDGAIGALTAVLTLVALVLVGAALAARHVLRRRQLRRQDKIRHYEAVQYTGPSRHGNNANDVTQTRSPVTAGTLCQSIDTPIGVVDDINHDDVDCRGAVTGSAHSLRRYSLLGADIIDIDDRRPVGGRTCADGMANNHRLLDRVTVEATV